MILKGDIGAVTRHVIPVKGKRFGIEGVEVPFGKGVLGVDHVIGVDQKLILAEIGRDTEGRLSDWNTPGIHGNSLGGRN